jgi:NAD(P)H-flavin reductase
VAEARISAVWPETPALLGMRLDVGREIAERYRRPGQYMMVRALDGAFFPMVIASSIGEPDLELLVGGEARARMPIEIGAEIEIGAPEGPGFPYERAIGRDVIVFAVGSALAAVKPLLELVRLRREAFERVVLFAGAKSWEEHAYRSCDELWSAARIEVRRSVGRPWIQERFAQDPLPLDNAMVFVCGMESMIIAVRTMLVTRGLPSDRFGANI